MLKDIEIGDVIQVKPAMGHTPMLSETKILENESELHIPAVEGNTYCLQPAILFAIPHAPNKYVVMAKEE